MVVGNSFATTAVNIYCAAPLRAWADRWPDHLLRVYLDDFTLETNRDTEKKAFRDTMSAGEDLREVIENDLASTISPPKAAIVASTPALTHRLAKAWGDLGLATLDKKGRYRKVTVALGMPLTAGARRSTCWKQGVSTRRFKKMIRRTTRIMKLVKSMPLRRRIFQTGEIPSALYGTEVYGVDEAEDKQLRATAAR